MNGILYLWPFRQFNFRQIYYINGSVDLKLYEL